MLFFIAQLHTLALTMGECNKQAECCHCCLCLLIENVIKLLFKRVGMGVRNS